MTCRLFKRIWKDNKEGKSVKIHIKIYPWMRNLQSWCQRMKAWETPAWWPSFLKTDRTEPLVVTPAQYKKLVRGCAVAVVVIVIAAGIGI